MEVLCSSKFKGLDVIGSLEQNTNLENTSKIQQEWSRVVYTT